MAPLVHQSLVLPAAFYAIWILDRDLSARRVARAACFGLAGLSVLLVVAVRSASGPAFAFGGRSRASGARSTDCSGESYGGLRQDPLAFDRLIAPGRRARLGNGGSVGIAAALVAMAGPFFRAVKVPDSALVALAALTVPAALVLLIAFNPDAEHFAQVAPFLAPVVASMSLFAGAGIGVLTRRGPRRRRPGAGGGDHVRLRHVLAHAACDRSGFRLADRYGRDLLAALPSGATLVLDGDNETFVAAYATRLAGCGPTSS